MISQDQLALPAPRVRPSQTLIYESCLHLWWSTILNSVRGNLHSSTAIPENLPWSVDGN